MSRPLRSIFQKSPLLRDVLPFDTDRARLTHMGRNAIWQAVRVLGLNPGDEILVPAYNCGSEIDPLFSHGLTVVPYRVRQSTQIDVVDISNRVTQRTRAVYVTHYFGFPQRLEPVVHLCREKHLFLIEDCALALFSRDGERFVGQTGDVAVFSLRKTLPVVDGGAVVINNPGLQMVGPLERPSLVPMLAALLPSAERSVRRWTHIEWTEIEKWYRLMRAGIKRLYKPNTPSAAQSKFVKVGGIDQPSLSWQDYYDPKISSWSISPISRRIIANVDPLEVIAKRRANFQYLLEALRDISEVEPLFKRLPEGVCPAVFPILTERRFQLYTALTQQGISAVEWWSGYHPGICWDRFPEEAYLKAHIVALPLHHGLGPNDMACIAACARQGLNTSLVGENRAQRARPASAG